MPAITSGKVLITGSNGYIASWTVKSFLDAGFSVRGTVRDESKAAHLKKVLSSYGDRLEFSVVPDMAKDGAFDTAAAGVDAIVHTCSPTNLNAVEPEEMITPAREGLLAALRAAARSPSVRRVVFTSSCATVVDPHATGPRVYDEECWNEGDIVEVESKGREASPVSKYRASKIVAERAAWKFFEDAKAEAAARNEECRWDLVVLNPPWVFGPVLHEVRGGPETLNASNVFWHSAVMKEKPLGFPHSWIDGRDVAYAHVLAVTKPAAGGQRFIVAEGPFRWEDFVLIGRQLSDKIPALSNAYDPAAEYVCRKNTMKARELLEMTAYRTKEETTRDILEQYAEHGWI